MTKWSGLSVRLRLALVGVCVVFAVGACSDDRAQRPVAGARPLAVGDPGSCEELAVEPFFQGDAETLLQLLPGGGPLTCTLKIRAGSPVLDELGLADDQPCSATEHRMVEFIRDDAGRWLLHESGFTDPGEDRCIP